ncbi:MAG: hypothetical protein QOE77_3619 [Blastocatellia bacterium]|nr:hypothetical protein [Blastocatellia bacterium]
MRYRSVHGRAQTVVVLLAITVVLHFFALLTSVIAMSLPTAEGVEIEDDPMRLLVGLFEIGVGLLQFVTFVATVVVFLMWLYRAYENLPAFGHWRSSIKFSSGWAVGSFFVPFVSLVVPYQAVKELWRKSEPANALTFGESGPPSFFPLWWGFWIVSNIVSQISFRMTLEQKAPADITNVVAIASDLLDIPAALLAIAVVRSIDRRQTEASQQVNVQFQAPPSPPPSFQPAAGQI